MDIQQKGNSILITEVDEKPIKIPSQMYPLTGQLCVVRHGNTEPFPDGEETERIREVFDSITPGLGTCYTNTRNLIDALAEIGVKATPYVGWVFIGGDSLPVHHCFASIGNHVLDLTVRPELFIPQGETNFEDIEQAREAIAQRFVSLEETPNSQKATFGQLSQYSMCFVSQCKPEEGLKQYQKLIKAYPKHPCYRNITEKRMSRTQEVIFEKMRKSD